MSEMAADRVDYFRCIIGKDVRLLNNDGMPMNLHGKIGKVVHQIENFVIVQFHGCEGWAPRVVSVHDVDVVKDNECYDGDSVNECSVTECHNNTFESIQLTFDQLNEESGMDGFSLEISICSSCFEMFLENHSIEECNLNYNTLHNAVLRLVKEK